MPLIRSRTGSQDRGPVRLCRRHAPKGLHRPGGVQCAKRRFLHATHARPQEPNTCPTDSTRPATTSTRRSSRTSPTACIWSSRTGRLPTGTTAPSASRATRLSPSWGITASTTSWATSMPRGVRSATRPAHSLRQWRTARLEKSPSGSSTPTATANPSGSGPRPFATVRVGSSVASRSSPTIRRSSRLPRMWPGPVATP